MSLAYATARLEKAWTRAAGRIPIVCAFRCLQETYVARTLEQSSIPCGPGDLDTWTVLRTPSLLLNLGLSPQDTKAGQL